MDRRPPPRRGPRPGAAGPAGVPGRRIGGRADRAGLARCSTSTWGATCWPAAWARLPRRLAFRPDEVAALLDARGLAGRPDDIAASSGGWAAGIVFDAIRGGPAQAGGGADDPFFAYLGSEVLDALPPDLRDAVLRSALLEVVTPARLATLLGVPSADEAFTAICRHHLPGTVDAEGLRYHPRFREFLLAELRRGEAGDLRALRARYGRALLAEDEAGGGRRRAPGRRRARRGRGRGGGRGTVALMRRADWDKVLRSCVTLGEPTLARRHDACAASRSAAS